MENVYKTLSVSVNICKNNGINVNMSMRFDCIYTEAKWENVRNIHNTPFPKYNSTICL